MRAVASCALAAVLSIASPALLAARAPDCTLTRLAEWPVRFHWGLPVVEGAINGTKVGVLLDTGAVASVLTKPAADRLGVYARRTREYLYGTGGESRMFLGVLEELRLGSMVRRDMRVRVGGERDLPGIDFILGDDFFRELDLELDYAAGVVRLFRPQDCQGRALAYWDRNAREVPLEPRERPFLAMKINGEEARALLDTGASTSQVALSFATKLGITPQSPGVVPSGCAWGIGADLVRNWVARFDTVEIAGQVNRDSSLRISDDAAEPTRVTRSRQDVILGGDFLRTHRVLVSRMQRKMYFTYLGGNVFAALPEPACEGRS